MKIKFAHYKAFDDAAKQVRQENKKLFASFLRDKKKESTNKRLKGDV